VILGGGLNYYPPCVSPAFSFKMIEYIVLIILILFIVYLIFTFISYTSIILNLIILIAFYFLIRKDLKDKENHKYYLFSLFLTAIILIFSSSGLIKYFLILTDKLLLSTAIVSLILVYLFANLISFVYEYLSHLKEMHKKKN